MRGSGKIFAVSCGPTAVASSVVSGSAIVALASRRLSERSLIALQIDFVLCCCDAQVVAAKGQFETSSVATSATELASIPDVGAVAIGLAPRERILFVRLPWREPTLRST